jgi:hypothetical protein
VSAQGPRVLDVEAPTFVGVLAGQRRLEVVERELRVHRDAGPAGQAHHAVGAQLAPLVAGAGHLKVVVDAPSQPRRLEDVGQLHLTPVPAVVGAAKELVQPARLLLGTLLGGEQLTGAMVHVAQRAAVLLIELREAGLVLIQERLEGLEREVQLGVALAHHALLGLGELLDGLGQHPVRHVLERCLQVGDGGLVRASLAVDRLARLVQLGAAHRQVRHRARRARADRRDSPRRNQPRRQRAHHQRDHAHDRRHHVLHPTVLSTRLPGPLPGPHPT